MFNLSKEQIEQFRTAMNRHIEETAKKNISKFDKALDIAVNKLVAEGWTLPAELPITAVNALGNSNELDDVNMFMEQFYTYDDYQNMKDIINGIQESKIKAGLIKLVNECWYAFSNKKYAICATALLSVIEGILSEFSDDKQDVRMMKICQKHVDTFPNNGSTITKHVWISYNQFIRNLYQKSDFTADEPKTINRHWLLHGRSNFDVEEIECMKLFNAVHSLCIVINNKSE